MLFDRNKLQQAMNAKKALQEEVVEVEEDGIKVRVRCDYKVLLVEVDGEKDESLKKVFEKVFKQLLKAQAAQLKGIKGGFEL